MSTRGYTRCGKRVGSAPSVMNNPFYVARYSFEEPARFVVVAPSGAKLDTHRTREAAEASCAKHQREWDAL